MYNDAPTASALGAAADWEQHVFSAMREDITPDQNDLYYYDQELLDLLDGLDCNSTLNIEQNIGIQPDLQDDPFFDQELLEGPQILDLPIDVSGDQFLVMNTNKEQGLAAPHDTVGSNVQARIISLGRCIVSDNIMEQDEEMQESKIQSVVCTTQLGCEIDLKHVSSHYLNASYDPKRHPTIFMWIRSPKGTAMIYKTRKLACKGAKNDATVKIAVQKFVCMMHILGYRMRLSKISIFLQAGKLRCEIYHQFVIIAGSA
ncbi:hypothetical protein L7F22_035562 [Adiantum nelumboides]|nr:hypothetical protein [Adiantum nelumboides]